MGVLVIPLRIILGLLFSAYPLIMVCITGGIIVAFLLLGLWVTIEDRWNR